MSNYSDIDNMWAAALIDVSAGGMLRESRAGQMKEVIGWSGTLLDCESTLLVNSRRRLSPAYAVGETMWYMAESDNLDHICAYAPSYRRFADNGRLWGAYGARLGYSFGNIPGTAVSPNARSLVCRELLGSRNSRQAVVPIFRPGDLMACSALEQKPSDVPCTLTLQFLLREDRLHMVVNMRSNDLWLGMPYDVFAFTSLQRMYAGELGVKPGTYTHHVGSLHVYEKDAVKCREALEVHGPSCKHGWSVPDRFDEIDRAVAMERELRVNGKRPRLAGIGDMACDFLRVATAHFLQEDMQGRFVSSAMETAYAHSRGKRPGGEDDAGPQAGGVEPTGQ